MSATVTPSMAHGVHVTPRLPDFAFDDRNVPENWFADDPGITAAWNALSVIAGVGEKLFVEAGRWLVERIDDPVVAGETLRFMQQEAFHAAVHARLNRVLAQRGLPVDAVRRLVEEMLREIEQRGGHSTLMAMGLAGEQAIGEIGHAVLAAPESMDGVAPGPRELFMWHWFEEVEHQASLHDGWTWLHGRSAEARARRVLGAVYALLVFGLGWPAATWAMLPPAARRRRFQLSTWRPLLRQMFGEKGLLRGGARNLRHLVRIDFHPFDMHDPKPTLDRHRATVVRPEWEMAAKTPKQAAHAQKIAVEPLRARDVWRAAGFGAWLLRRTARFLRETA